MSESEPALSRTQYALDHCVLTVMANSKIGQTDEVMAKGERG